MEERFIISIERERRADGGDMPEQQSSSGYGICCLFGSVAPGFPLRSSSIVTDLYYIDVFLSKNTGGGGLELISFIFRLSSLSLFSAPMI